MKITAIITKCSNLYTSINNETEAMNKLLSYKDQWRKRLEPHGIEEVFFLNDLSYKQLQNNRNPGWFSYFFSQEVDRRTLFFIEEWRRLYEILENSQKAKMRIWKELSETEQNSIGQYFYYRVGKSQEQIDAEIKAFQEHKAKLDKEYEEMLIKMLQDKQNILQYQQQIQRLEAEIQYMKEILNKKEKCVSLDVLIQGINNNTLKINSQLFNTQMTIKGYREQNSILGLIHFTMKEQCNFITLQYDYQGHKGFVELTSEHLIYCPNRQTFITAEQVNLNDTLLFDNNEEQVEVQITQISHTTKIGYYTPLTSTGYFFGNGILVSSYSSPSQLPVSQEVAHIVMKPLIIYRQLMMNGEDENQNQNILDQEQSYEDYNAPYNQLISWVLEKI